MGEPSVSVVIATYNRAHLLPESMESVLGQDYPDLELLVVDDGSTDGTPELLAAYAQRLSPRRFRFVRQANGGQSRALNHGYSLARGELIGYLSDDDLLAPGAVAAQARALAADPGAAVAYSGYHVIDIEGTVEGLVRPIEYSPVEALRLHDTVIGPGGLTRREALLASGGWIESMRYMADLVLWMDVGLRGRAIRIDEPLVSWRRHAGSVTANVGPEHAREHFTAYRRGLALEGLPALSESVRAEGLRNACVWAAIFRGPATTWPGDRYMIFDFHRKLISAPAAGLDMSSTPDWDSAARAARRYRELVTTVVALRRAREGESEESGRRLGVEPALDILRAVGAIAAADGSLREVGESQMRLGLIGAALAAGAATDPATNRFGIVDLARVRLRDDERARLEALGFVGGAEEIEAELERYAELIA